MNFNHFVLLAFIVVASLWVMQNFNMMNGSEYFISSGTITQMAANDGVLPPKDFYVSGWPYDYYSYLYNPWYNPYYNPYYW